MQPVLVTHCPLASQEVAGATRGQQGSALPHPAATQLHARLEQEPGIQQDVGVKPHRCLARHVLPAWGLVCGTVGCCSWGECNHQGVLVSVLFVPGDFLAGIFPVAPHLAGLWAPALSS